MNDQEIIDQLIENIKLTLGDHEPESNYETGYFDAMMRVLDYLEDGKWEV